MPRKGFRPEEIILRLPGPTCARARQEGGRDRLSARPERGEDPGRAARSEIFHSLREAQILVHPTLAAATGWLRR